MSGLLYDSMGPYGAEKTPSTVADYRAAFNNGDKLSEANLWTKLQTCDTGSSDYPEYVRAIRDLQILQGQFAKAEGREPEFAGPDIRDCRDNDIIADMVVTDDEPVAQAVVARFECA